MFDQMGINEFTKQNVIDYANSSEIMSSLYLSLFITVFIYAFTTYLLTTVSNALVLCLFGYLTSWLAKLKIRWVAILNMSIYALTLSVLLNAIYIGINIFIDFNIEYFQVMYLAVAAIYLIASIFILKDDFIKKQQELIKVLEEQAKIKQEKNEQEQEKEKEKNKDEEKKEEPKEENKKDEKKENGKDNEKKKNNHGKRDLGEPEAT